MSKTVKIHYATYFNNLKELLQNPGTIREDLDLQARVRQTKELDDDLIADLLDYCGLNGSITNAVLNWLHANARSWDSLQRTVDNREASRLARQVIRLAPKAPPIDTPKFDRPEPVPAPAPAQNPRTVSGPPSIATRQSALRKLYSGNIDDLAMLLLRAFTGTPYKAKIDTLMVDHLRGYDPADDVSALVKATGSHFQLAWFAENLIGTEPLHDIALGLAIYLEGFKEELFTESYSHKFTQESIERVRQLASELLPRLTAVIEGKPLPALPTHLAEPISAPALLDLAPAQETPPSSVVDQTEKENVIPFVDPHLLREMRTSVVHRLALEHPLQSIPSMLATPEAANTLFPPRRPMGELICFPHPSLGNLRAHIMHPTNGIRGSLRFMPNARGLMAPRRMIPVRA